MTKNKIKNTIREDVKTSPNGVPEEPKKLTGEVLAGFLNCRKEPSLESELAFFGPLMKGTHVKILAISDEWVKAETKDGVCYLLSEFVRII